MSLARVSPDPAGRGGFALLRVPDAAPYLATPSFRLQRQDERAPFLGPQGWQPAENLLQPANAWTDGDDLILELGPAVVDAVEAGTVGFTLAAGLLSFTLIWPALPPSRRGGQSVFQEARARPEPKPERTRAALVTAPQITPPDPKPEVKSLENGTVEPRPVPKPKTGLYLAIGGGVLVLAAVLYFALRPIPHSPQKLIQQMQASAPAVPAPTRPAIVPDCDSLPYPAVLQCETDPVKLFAVAQNFAKSGQMQAAVAVYQVSADGNYGAAALALAELYDPATFQPNAAVAHADPAQAAKYYKQAVTDGDHDAAAPRQNLYNSLQTAKAQGDMQAPLTLNDYWP